jgi:hypothetical protein
MAIIMHDDFMQKCGSGPNERLERLAKNSKDAAEQTRFLLLLFNAGAGELC